MTRRTVLRAMGATIVSANTLLPVSAAEPGPALRGLGHTFSRLRAGEDVTIGYFGGSITEGAGASKPNKNWRALTMAHFRERFPKAKITEANAAIGGTGSDLGAFRINDDLLSHKPDLVFVEFAVNDGGGQEERTLRSMEGIVRHIWRSDPATDIVFIYTANKAMEPAYAKNDFPNSVKRHQRVAAHYGIPEVNVGKTLYDAIAGQHGGDWRSLTRDDTHPNDDGYAIYTTQIDAFLDSHADDKAPATSPALPGPLTPHPLENGRLLDSWSLPETKGWTREEKTLSNRYPHRLVATSPDADVLMVPFIGDAIGVYWQITPDGGEIECSLDDGPWTKRSAWDKYALSFSRAGSFLISDTLPSGSHTLKIRVLPTHDAQSTGTVIRIGAFLVDG